jgi:CheY-like chemotaxis protein
VPYQLLLADSSLTIQRVIRLTFADEDVNLTTVGDGNDAVAAIDKSPPDIVLADISLPGRTGYDVARHLRDTPRLAHIPVVLLTGAFDAVDEARAASVGCDRVLSKPFDPQVVILCVRELLAGPRKIVTPAASLEVVEEGETVAAPAAGVEAVAGVDDYLDRFDMAFSNRPGSPEPAAVGQPEPFAIEIEGLEPAPAPTRPSGGTLTGVEPLADNPGPVAFDPPRQIAGHDSPESARQSDSGAAAVRSLFPIAQSSAASPVVSDELIEEIVTRVIDRLMVRLSTGNVPEIVTAVVERLVRAEIDIIKSRL